MVAEYSNDQYRQLAINVVQSGYPVGLIIAGIAAAYLLRHYDWRAIFVVGGVLSLAMIPIVTWRLPESFEFLLNSQPSNALKRINAILPRLNQAVVSELPAEAKASASKASALEVFSRRFRARTSAICIGYLALMSAD